MKKFISTLLILTFTTSSLFAGYASQMKSAKKDYFSHKLESSLKKYKQISKDYLDKDAFLNATFIAWELANPNYAVDIITVALKNHPEDNDVLEFAAETYLLTGNYFLAEKTFSTLVSMHPSTEIYLINLARAQIGLGMKDMAEKNLKKATKGKEHLSLSNYLLGKLYFQQKNYKKAVKYLSKVNKYDNQFLESKKLYADALLKAKKHKEAWDNYQTVASSEHSLKDVKKAITQAGGKIEKKEKVIRYVNIKSHTNITRPISFTGSLPTVKIGIGAKINGAPIVRKSIEFIPSHKFRIFEARTKKLLYTGSGKEKIKLKVYNQQANILNGAGKVLASFRGSIIVEQSSDIKNSHTTIVKRVTIGHGTTWKHYKDMEYRGNMEFAYNAPLNGIITINHVNIEEYVFGVLHAEMPPQFSQEALKAQAVLARTYGYKHLHKHSRWGYDLCDTQNCQVYGGVKQETEEGIAAVESTIGEILTYKGKAIEAVFSSNCGGFTQSSKDAGWFDHDYLSPKSDYKDLDVKKIQPYHFKNLLL
ncbi:MAG: SpoIID/LytB domain-containing protein, partial [Elusimicrobiaceae bacterium]|nr:SpoIID/LytB domain-containing protein [Elusimicrobiaceae bacterium]